MCARRMAPSLAVAALLWAGPALAGPWCIEPLLIAPRPGHVLPPQPELLLFRERARYGGELLPEAPRLVVRATINGKAAAVALHRERTGGFDLTFVKVKSTRRGALELRAEHRCRAHRRKEIEYADFPTCFESALAARYTIAEAPPSSTTEVGPIEAQYDTRIGLKRNDYYFFFGLPVRLPALWFEVRWRRDAQAKWSSFVAPAYPVLGEAREEDLDTESIEDEPAPDQAERPRRAELRIGEQRCHAPSISLALLQRGIEVELLAKLPDGRTLPLTGVPPQLVYPDTQQTRAREQPSKTDASE